MLATVSFTKRWLSTSCARATEPHRYDGGGLAAEIRRRAVIRCTAPGRIRIHVNAIVNGDSPTKEPIGNALDIGVGEPFREIAAVVIKNRGDPQASSVYPSRCYCTTA